MNMKKTDFIHIGSIPIDWDVVRLKDIAQINKGNVFDENLALAEGIYPYINGGINPSDWSNEFNSKENTIAVSEGGASAGYTQFMRTKYWAGSHCYKIQSKNKHSDNKYLFYVLKGFEPYLMIEKTGSAMPNLQKTKFINYLVSFVNDIEAQNKIVSYLDTETSKIDRKISILEQKFEKLEEYKQSVIFETVTKGLDKNVPLKDSGIDWIGEIPEHWEVKRVKEFVRLSQGLSVNSSEYVDESDVVLIRMGNIKKGGAIDLNHKNVYLPQKFKKSSKQYILKENDIIIAMTDMSPNLDFLGVPAKLVNLNKDTTYVLNQRVGKLNFKTKNLNFDFFKYYLMTPLAKNQFKAEGLGTIQGNMSDSHFSNLFFIYPTLDEQTEMVIYLNEVCSKIDKKTSIIKKQIELLKEYKQTIIYEAVTGKMEIL